MIAVIDARNAIWENWVKQLQARIAELENAIISYRTYRDERRSRHNMPDAEERLFSVLPRPREDL